MGGETMKPQTTTAGAEIDNFTANEIDAMAAKPGAYEAAMIRSAIRHDPRQTKLDLPAGRTRHRLTTHTIG
jgi:hypothetical protein